MPDSGRMDDHLAAVAQTSTSIKNSPYTSGSDKSAFFTAHGMKMYDYYEQNPEKGKRFAQAMSGWSQCKSWPLLSHIRCKTHTGNIVDRQVSEMRDAFRWESLGNGTVVDIGGGSGHISMALAKVRLP
jgi:hypothetical protein